jgi:MFS family permease
MSSLPRTVFLLAWVSFFNDIASDMVIPLLPLLLAGPVGGGALALGAIEGTADAVASLMRLWAGRRSDRGNGRRKPLAVAGYALSNAVRPLFGLAPFWWSILALRAVDRVGKGVRSAPRDALMADVTPASQRGAAFGLHRAFDNAGAVVGALLAAAILATQGTSLGTVVLWSALPGLLSVLLLAFGVREPDRGQGTPIQSAAMSPPVPVLAAFIMPPELRAYLRALLLFTLSRASETFIVLRGAELGIAPGHLLLLWAGLNAAKALTAHLGGRWADHRGRLFVLRLSWIGNVLTAGGLAWAPDAVALSTIALLGSLPVGLGEGAERAHIADLAPPEQRGTAYGWYNMTTGAAAIPAGLVFGGLWQYSGAPTAFAVAAAIGALALLALPSVAGRNPALPSSR